MDQCGIFNRIIEEWFALIVWPVTLKMNIVILCVATSAAKVKVSDNLINPYLTNGFSHHYQLDESTFIFRDVRSDF